jgi:molybdopterin synthase catalytic subunit
MDRGRRWAVPYDEDMPTDDGAVAPFPPSDPACRVWAALSPTTLPAATLSEWVRRPDCGALVTFTGTVRDHAEGRPGVHELEYEAYEEQVAAKLAEVGADALTRFPTVGRIALLHRVGRLAVGEDAVVVATSAPHRDAAFEAARFGIDTLKQTVPIWKRERWRDGEAWGIDASPLPIGAEARPPR